MNTASDIPDGELHAIAGQTDLDVPELPGEWGWTSANHLASFNGKVNIYFGLHYEQPGGWYGEIDNFQDGDGTVQWCVSIRPVIDDGTDSGSIESEAEIVENYDTLDEAIESVPKHIATNFETEMVSD